MSVENLRKKEIYTIGVSTSAIFDMSIPDSIYRQQGIEAYREHMRQTIEKPLPFGAAFEIAAHHHKMPGVKIVLISRNNDATASRAILTLNEQGLTPEQFIFTNGQDPMPFLKLYNIDLFLSTNEGDVKAANDIQVSSALIESKTISLPFNKRVQENVVPIGTGKQIDSNVVVIHNKPAQSDHKIHYIFDIDGVLAGIEHEEYFKKHGLEAYRDQERQNVKRSLTKGPHYPLLKKLSDMNASGGAEQYLISVVTARGVYAAMRAIYTFRDWGININGQLHCMAGQEKGPVLKIIEKQHGLKTLFFDDRKSNIESAQRHGGLSGHVVMSPVDGRQPA
jgi:5'-nucleotidase